jgi:hypothetical protein
VLATVALGLVVVPTASAWTVSMTANPSFKRTYSWKIEKSVSQPRVTLGVGETADVTYSVTVTSTGFTDSDWRVDGTVDITSDPDIQINSLNVYGQSPNLLQAGVTCVPDPPSTLAAGMNCTYGRALPDASDRTALMRASVTDLSTGVNGGRVAQKPYSFAGVAPQEIDECVSVTDSMAGSLGTVCAGEAPKTFTYTRTVGGYAECGDFEVDNTASFLTNDTGATGSDGASVDVTVPCEPPPGGCTRTIGYWKTHAGFGPQADAVTPLLPILLGTGGGANTLNVSTAAFAVQLLEMKGSNNVKDSSNGLNKLYAQLLGAKLNGESGADISSVSATIAAADAFLASHNSLSWSGLSSTQQQTVLGWMTTLDNYNNGLVGPTHCD